MIYPLLRSVAGIALRWYYSGIDVEGLDRVPRRSPLLIVANHPNALVDALVVGWVVPRRLMLTAKSTLFTNPLAAAALRGIGVVPLRRAKDEIPANGADPRRNDDTFRAVHAALAAGRAVTIFPEGISHDLPTLAPIRTGAARIALAARGPGGVEGMQILPIGLTFERKEAPRSRVLVQVGTPIDVATWTPRSEETAVADLTAEIDARLRAVTLNFDSSDDAARTMALASLFARLRDELPEVSTIPSLGDEVAIARRLGAAQRALEHAPPALQARADELVQRLETFDRRLAAEELAFEDVTIVPTTGAGVRFTAREAFFAFFGAPVSLWGAINHWLPFHAARAIAMRDVESAADPAMRTIVAGAVLVLAFYGVQAALVAKLFGALAATLYVISLPLAADINFALRERLQRVRSRARAYLRFRRSAELQHNLSAELRMLREEALSLDQALEVATSEARASDRIGA